MSKNRKGFSLIEMIIAIAIVGIVMSSVLVLISYASNNMRRTTNRVSLQNQAKDAVTHITTHIQEGTDTRWDEITKHLTVIKVKRDNEGNPIVDDEGNRTAAEIGHYIYSDGVIYFYKYSDMDVFDNKGRISDTKVADNNAEAMNALGLVTISTEDEEDGEEDEPETTVNNAQYVFAKNVIEFNCEVLDEKTVGTTPEPVPTPVDSTDSVIEATPLPGTIVSIGNKRLKVTVSMKNETEDARFSSTKEIYLRNQ